MHIENDYNTRQSKHFAEIFSIKNYRLSVIACRGPRLWNSIICPFFNLNEIPFSKEVIKKLIKLHMVSKYQVYNVCTYIMRIYIFFYNTQYGVAIFFFLLHCSICVLTYVCNPYATSIHNFVALVHSSILHAYAYMQYLNPLLCMSCTCLFCSTPKDPPSA